MDSMIAFMQSRKADNDAARRKNERESEAINAATREIDARIERMKANEKIQPGHAHPGTEQPTVPTQDPVEKFLHWLKDERKTLETLKMMVASPSGNKTDPAIRLWNKFELLRDHDFKLDFSKKLRPHDKSEDHCSLIWLQFSRISPNQGGTRKVSAVVYLKGLTEFTELVFLWDEEGFQKEFKIKPQ